MDADTCLRRGRLDAHYHLAPGVQARDRIAQAASAGLDVIALGDLGTVWQPGRLKQVPAAQGEDAKPYLRPYDVFDCLPQPASWLSATRAGDTADYRIEPGLLLLTRSGRNLGPLTVADAVLSAFLLSDDMLRVGIVDGDMRHYAFVALASPTGQAMLRQQMSGSVVDHVTVRDAQAFPILYLPKDQRVPVVELARTAVEDLAVARERLHRVMDRVQQRYPPPQRDKLRKLGWTVTSGGLGARLDPHFHDPSVAAARRMMQQAGGVRCGDVADAFLPGRYKRYYVDSKHGRPITSGTQLLQINPINLRYISDRSFKNPEAMLLRSGMVAFGAVGRWEGRLGQPALITADRHGWMASNDVMRLTSKPGVTPGWLWAAIACAQTQAQIAALPYGSVIDHTGPSDIEDIILPPPDRELGALAEAAWEGFAAARLHLREAVQLFESAVDSYVGPDRV